MRARFVGDPNDDLSGPQELTCWGVEFVKGEWREVDDVRFATHSHFEADDGETPKRGRKAAATDVVEGGGA